MGTVINHIAIRKYFFILVSHMGIQQLTQSPLKYRKKYHIYRNQEFRPFSCRATFSRIVLLSMLLQIPNNLRQQNSIANFRKQQNMKSWPPKQPHNRRHTQRMTKRRQHKGETQCYWSRRVCISPSRIRSRGPSHQGCTPKQEAISEQFQNRL